MTYEDFQHLARLFIVGSLDEDEMDAFHAGRKAFGARAEAFLAECHDLNAIFALSLRPMPPSARAKAELLARIKAMPERPRPQEPEAPEAIFVLPARDGFTGSRFPGRN